MVEAIMNSTLLMCFTRRWIHPLQAVGVETQSNAYDVFGVCLPVQSNPFISSTLDLMRLLQFELKVHFYVKVEVLLFQFSTFRSIGFDSHFPKFFFLALIYRI